jgi:hypothetical protein
MSLVSEHWCDPVKCPAWPTFIWVRSLSRVLPQLTNYILFMDEAQFHCGGMINARNLYCWLYDSPHEAVQENFQHTLSVHICCGIVGHISVRDVWQLHLTDILQRVDLENVPLQRRRQMWMQCDRVSRHFERGFIGYWNENCRGRWTTCMSN